MLPMSLHSLSPMSLHCTLIRLTTCVHLCTLYFRLAAVPFRTRQRRPAPWMGPVHRSGVNRGVRGWRCSVVVAASCLNSRFCDSTFATNGSSNSCVLETVHPRRLENASHLFWRRLKRMSTDPLDGACSLKSSEQGCSGLVLFTFVGCKLHR